MESSLTVIQFNRLARGRLLAINHHSSANRFIRVPLDGLELSLRDQTSAIYAGSCVNLPGMLVPCLKRKVASGAHGLHTVEQRALCTMKLKLNLRFSVGRGS